MQREINESIYTKETDTRRQYSLWDGDRLHQNRLSTLEGSQYPTIQRPASESGSEASSDSSGCSGQVPDDEELDASPCRLADASDGTHPDLHRMDTEMDLHGPNNEENMATSAKNTRSLRTRSVSNRIFTDKVRYRRQTLQQMSRPLKRWLYRHKDKPYPSRAEKQSLAAGSNMTLTQVSNWFANVRRRLKNTVPSPDGSWSTRILRYNDYVEGNAELFSVYSDDGESESDDDSDTGAATRNSTAFPLDSDLLSDDGSPTNDQGDSFDCNRHLSFTCRRTLDDDNTTPSPDPLDMIDQELMSHPKFKQTILQRYLNDTYNHAGFRVDRVTANDERQVSDSLCSADYEMSTTSSSPRVNGEHRTMFDDANGTDERNKSITSSKDILDKEVTAIIALTTMAQLKRKI